MEHGILTLQFLSYVVDMDMFYDRHIGVVAMVAGGGAVLIVTLCTIFFSVFLSEVQRIPMLVYTSVSCLLVKLSHWISLWKRWRGWEAIL